MQAGEKYIAIVRWGKTINKRGTVQKPPDGKSLQKKNESGKMLFKNQHRQVGPRPQLGPGCTWPENVITVF